MMPDGSRDMYVGIGLSSAPRYKGADTRDTDPVALLQVQWSNGVFLSGTSVGMHLSDAPALEYGPLLAIEPGRNASGKQRLTGIGQFDSLGPTSAASPTAVASSPRFTDVRSRPTMGGFFNYYFDESLRLTSSLLYGSGEDRNGLLLNAGVQKSFAAPSPHHRLSLSAGATWANRRYQQAYFGVPAAIAGAASYVPSSGMRDVNVTFNWNWELSHAWLLASQLSATRLMGSAADSPLTDRRNNLAVRTGLAYRF